MASVIPLVIAGAGGHGKDIEAIIGAINAVRPTYLFKGYLDDNLPVGDRVLGKIDLLKVNDIQYVIGVNDPQVRFFIDSEIPATRDSPILVHPNASIGPDCLLSPGSVVASGAILTTHVRLGRHAHVNVNATISQTSSVGDYSTVSPGANICGSCRIGDRSYIAAGSTIINVKEVGDDCTVGAGAVVISDIPSGTTVVGVPARPIRK